MSVYMHVNVCTMIVMIMIKGGTKSSGGGGGEGECCAPLKKNPAYMCVCVHRYTVLTYTQLIQCVP